MIYIFNKYVSTNVDIMDKNKKSLNLNLFDFHTHSTPSKFIMFYPY